MTWPKARRSSSPCSRRVLLHGRHRRCGSEAATATPAVVETRVIGTHRAGPQHRRLAARASPTSRRKVVVLAAMHGDETGPVADPLQPARRPADPRRRHLGGAARTTATAWSRHTRQNAHGVDLNRNYPRSWKRLTRRLQLRPAAGLGAGDPGGDGLPDGRCARTTWSASTSRCTASGAPAPRARPSCSACTAGCGLPVKSFNCSGVCHGTMTEWFNATFPGVAVTVEYGRGRQQQAGHPHRARRGCCGRSARAADRCVSGR